MSNSKRDKISNLDADSIKEIEDSRIIVYGICIAILIAGVFIGYTLSKFSGSSVFQTVATLLIGLVVTGFSPYFMKRFIEKYTSAIKKRHEKDKAEIEENYKDKIAEIKKKHSIEINNWSRGLNNPYRVSQDLEFLSMMFKDTGDPNPISSFSAFCKEIVDLNNDQRLVEKLVEYEERINDREVALSGINKGFTKKDEDIVYPFSRLIVDACNFAFDKVDENGKPCKDLQASLVSFYGDIRTYLRAWLSCSIKYGVQAPIKPIYNQYLQLNGERIHCGKDRYITAIKYFQEKTCNNKVMSDQYFTTLGSRKIVIEYLDGLIKILESEIDSEVKSNSSNCN